MASAPRVSVVVSTRNRSESLRALLASLRRQTLPAADFEVIVADNVSTDDTLEVLAAAAEAAELQLRVIRRERDGGAGAGRNDGWRAARARLIAFTDDDCVPDPDWLAAGLRAAARHPDAIVQGRTDPDPAELNRLGPFSRTMSIPQPSDYFQTCNVFYPRELLERVGGFDAAAFFRSGEDTDLAWRAIERGAATTFAPDARVLHAVRNLGPVGKLRMAARWSETVLAFKRHPELRRRQLRHGVFWKDSHYLLLRASLALAVPRRHRVVRLWLVLPYLRHLSARTQAEGGGPLAAPFHLLFDLVEIQDVARGALRYRTLVL